MKKSRLMKMLIVLILLPLGMATFFGCGKKKAKFDILIKDNTCVMAIGQSMDISQNVELSNNKKYDFNITIDDNDVVLLNNNQLCAVGIGECQVTVKVKDKTAKFAIVVIDDKLPNITIEKSLVYMNYNQVVVNNLNLKNIDMNMPIEVTYSHTGLVNYDYKSGKITNINTEYLPEPVNITVTISMYNMLNTLVSKKFDIIYTTYDFASNVCVNGIDLPVNNVQSYYVEVSENMDYSMDIVLLGDNSFEPEIIKINNNTTETTKSSESVKVVRVTDNQFMIVANNFTTDCKYKVRVERNYNKGQFEYYEFGVNFIVLKPLEVIEEKIFYGEKEVTFDQLYSGKKYTYVWKTNYSINNNYKTIDKNTYTKDFVFEQGNNVIDIAMYYILNGNDAVLEYRIHRDITVYDEPNKNNTNFLLHLSKDELYNKDKLYLFDEDFDDDANDDGYYRSVTIEADYPSTVLANITYSVNDYLTIDNGIITANQVGSGIVYCHFNDEYNTIVEIPLTVEMINATQVLVDKTEINQLVSDIDQPIKQRLELSTIPSYANKNYNIISTNDCECSILNNNQLEVSIKNDKNISLTIMCDKVESDIVKINIYQQPENIIVRVNNVIIDDKVYLQPNNNSYITVKGVLDSEEYIVPYTINTKDRLITLIYDKNGTYTLLITVGNINKEVTVYVGNAIDSIMLKNKTTTTTGIYGMVFVDKYRQSINFEYLVVTINNIKINSNIVNFDRAGVYTIKANIVGSTAIYEFAVTVQ